MNIVLGQCHVRLGPDLVVHCRSVLGQCGSVCGRRGWDIQSELANILFCELLSFNRDKTLLELDSFRVAVVEFELNGTSNLTVRFYCTLP